MSIPKLPSLKKIFLIILSVPFFVILGRLCHRATDGFALTRMTNPLPLDAEFIPPSLSEAELREVHGILAQPFYYLSCGGQSYVFLSQDGRYVIKFSKFHHLRVPPWITYLPLPKSLEEYRQKKIVKKDFVLKRTLRSYVVAYNYFKQETGIVYHHLQKTNDFHQDLVFFDKLGYKYEISLDDYAFVLQKRGMSTLHMLQSLMKEGRQHEAQEKLEELLQLALWRCQKGLADRDFKFKSNLGFIEGKAAQIDLGSLSLDERTTNPDFYYTEVKRAGLVLRDWLQQVHPELVAGFELSLNKLQKPYAGGVSTH
ncbi:MAG: hypothetical protein FJZ63_01010 [Chlamydiae bacterium]|nr:hypothetical protein [Chlamydiota bacterium]